MLYRVVLLRSSLLCCAVLCFIVLSVMFVSTAEDGLDNKAEVRHVADHRGAVPLYVPLAHIKCAITKGKMSSDRPITRRKMSISPSALSVSLSGVLSL